MKEGLEDLSGKIAAAHRRGIKHSAQQHASRLETMRKASVIEKEDERAKVTETHKRSLATREKEIANQVRASLGAELGVAQEAHAAVKVELRNAEGKMHKAEQTLAKVKQQRDELEGEKNALLREAEARKRAVSQGTAERREIEEVRTEMAEAVGRWPKQAAYEAQKTELDQTRDEL
eukprot:6719159-Prymnesium_polylepis.1